MKYIKYNYMVADFETTVYDGQQDTQVWAASCAEVNDPTDKVHVFGSIGGFIDYLVGLNKNVCCYFHNLKFDGSFILSHFMVDLGYKNAIDCDKEKNIGKFRQGKEIKAKEISYSISSQGQWYNIQVKVHGKVIEFRDSLKLLPFTLEKIGKDFETKHKKLTMEYKGARYPNCKISDEELAYIKNDCLVLKEAIEIMFKQGHKKLTIGSCCLSEYKKALNSKYYDRLFPNLYDEELDDEYGAENVGKYVHKSYKGGWCYLVEGKEKQIKTKGITLDVNSLYPSMMSSESGNVYPIGKATFWKGDYIPLEALSPERYYFVRVRTRFYLKPGYLPFIQLKSTFRYAPTEMLKTSDIYNPDDGQYYKSYIDFNGEEKQALVELTLTQTDWELVKEHYELVDCEILDGCYFNSAIGIFDDYINKYKQIKLNSKGALRALAKLFSNNLYGKMAASPTANFKVAYVKEDRTIGFRPMQSPGKTPGYIPVGSAITSYARNWTIRAAQKNYYGADNPGFIYADTDSLHLDIPINEIKGVELDEKEYCKWKLESEWDIGYFCRQKTYAEHGKNGWELKCAGMPDRCKELFIATIEGEESIAKITPNNEAEAEFLKTRRKITDLDIGLCVPGKLTPRRIRGGVLLVDDVFTLRK